MDQGHAESSTGNSPQSIWPICPYRLILWDIFEKKPLSYVPSENIQTHYDKRCAESRLYATKTMKAKAIDHTGNMTVSYWIEPNIKTNFMRQLGLLPKVTDVLPTDL